MRRPWGLTGTDVALPLALALAGVVEAFNADVNTPVAVVTSLLAGVLLCARRRWPLAASLGASAPLILQGYLGVPEDELVVPLGMYFVAGFAMGRWARLWPGLAGLAAVNVMVHESEGWSVPTVQGAVWVLLLTGGPWLAGRLALEHARRSEELARQARELVREQAQLAERLVTDERRRIAREMHDVVAHSLSVMVVQAGAAADLLRHDPDEAARALDEIQRAGRSALDETGRLLHLLREEQESEVGPQPAAADLPELVEGFRSAGLDVELVVRGSTAGLPAGVDLSVFRIVQEGLTNALKHAPSGRTVVTVRRALEGIDVELRNEAGTGPEPVPSGHGLVGMRERVAVFGGSLDAGPVDHGGYRVLARLPLDGGAR